MQSEKYLKTLFSLLDIPGPKVCANLADLVGMEYSLK